MSLPRSWPRVIAATLLLWVAGLAAPAGAVTLAPSVTALAISTSSPAGGQSVTLTASVSGSNATGNVTFKDGASVLGVAPMSNGSASLTIRFTAPGAHSLTASYAGNSGVVASSSPMVQAVVSVAPTTVSLAANLSPATVGQTVTLSASVTGSTPTGAVVFRDGTVTLGSAILAGGTANLTVSFAAAGTHTLTASYNGNATNASSTSAALAQPVSAVASTTTLSAANNPASVGQAILLTVRVAGLNPAGTVTFRDGSTALGTAALSGGMASLRVSFASPGSHVLTASYGGNAANAASTSAAVTENVTTAATSTLLAASPQSSAIGKTVTLTAHVSGAGAGSATGAGTGATGSVTFSDGTSILGSSTLINGAATLAVVFNSVGGHSLVATYSGDGNFSGSNSGVVVTTVTPAVATVTLGASSATPAIGQPVRLTAQVAGYAPSGGVSFTDGNTALGTVNLSGGTATLTTVLTSAGAHSIKASFAGDATDTAASSAVLRLNASPAPTTLTLSPGSKTITKGVPVLFQAAVQGYNPTGSVTIRYGSVSTVATLSNGVGSASLTFPASGTFTLTANYPGNSNNSASAATLSVTVGTTTPTPGGPATGNGINYHGGPVMNSGVNLYYIWYGDWSGNTAPTILTQFGQGLGGSAYWHAMTTYSDSTARAVSDSVTLLGQATDNYSQGKALSDAQIPAIVSNAISSGQLPADPNGFYVVLSSQDVSETSGFCTQYCGWHSATTIAGLNLTYSFIGNPDRCPSACEPGISPNGNHGADGMASVLAHELAETVTDPTMNAWYDSNYQEVGDKCAWNFGTRQTANNVVYNVQLSTGYYYIQQEWVNARGGACVLSYP